MNTTLMFSSKTGKWDTPAELIAQLSHEFNWDWDVCADRPNVCEHYYDEQIDGLEQKWRGLCWMNPPYGREIGKWVGKAASSPAATVVCLLPARTDTHWWHNNIWCASIVVFIRGRLVFGSQINSAPFPSAFVVFGDGLLTRQVNLLASYGWRAK